MIVNDGPAQVRVDLAPLAAPSLALQVLDAQGEPVLLPPPPVPGGPSWGSLPAGETRSFTYAGFVPSWTAPGRYRVRFRYVYRPATPDPADWTGELVSDWVDFEVRE